MRGGAGGGAALLGWRVDGLRSVWVGTNPEHRAETGRGVCSRAVGGGQAGQLLSPPPGPRSSPSPGPLWIWEMVSTSPSQTSPWEQREGRESHSRKFDSLPVLACRGGVSMPFSQGNTKHSTWDLPLSSALLQPIALALTFSPGSLAAAS